MRPGEADRVLTLLEVYWPNWWSPRNSNQHKERVKEELDDMFRNYKLDDVEKVIKDLGRSSDKTPSYSAILNRLKEEVGNITPDGLGYHWEQYIFQVYRDERGREYVRTCNVKVFDDGTFELPKGVPYNERMLRRSGIIQGDKKPEPEEGEVPEGFQQLIDGIFDKW